MEVVYTWPWYPAAGTIAVVVALSWWSWGDFRRRGFNATIAVAGLIALAALAIQLPSYFLDEIRIDQETMRWHEGPWWARAEGSIDFADVESVRIVKRLQAGVTKNRHMEEVWILQSSRGTTNEVIVSRLWMEHYQDIKAHFVAKGISIAPAPQ